MGLRLVAIDCGRSGVKGVIEGKREYFSSAVSPYRRLKLERRMNRNDFTVEYDGERYFVGDIGKEENGGGGSQMMLATKAHPDTRILVLTMLSRLFPGDASVFLMTGAPIESRDQGEIMRIKKLLIGTHKFYVNDETRVFEIVRCEVAAEAATATWALRRPGTFTIVDPGSRTVNYATMRNGKWVDYMSGTLDYGIEALELNKSQFVRMMIADLSKKLRTLPPLILIGGMAQHLAEYFAQYGAVVEVHPDPLFANAQAYYDLGVTALEQAKKA